MSKEAQGFGYGEKGQSFELKNTLNNQPVSQQPAALEKSDVPGQIVLNIAQARDNKILLHQKHGLIKFTGNPLLDIYKRLNDFVIEHSKVKVRDKAVFFRLLAVMLNAGLPLTRSLTTLGVQSDKSPQLAKILFAMARAIENGQSLSGSMSYYPEVFTDSEMGVIKAGEASGQLNKALRSLAQDVEKTASITGKIKGAMIYPLVILTLLAAAIFLMMIMVVPQITSLFTQAEQELPLPTKILIAMSDFCVNQWPLLLLIIVLAVGGFSFWRKTRSGRYILDYVKLQLPIFGPIFQKSSLSRFTRGFSNLLSSGVPIIKSLEIVSHGVGNEVYKRRLILTAEDMKRGIPMAENMAESQMFPKMLVNMIEVGEQTAQLESVTMKVADFYDEEVDTVIASLTKILEPLILVVIGLTVGGLVAAIMLPIMSLTNSAGAF